MAFLRTTVTGSIFLPDGSVMPDGANIIFTLRSWDKDADLDAVALPGPIVATVEDGAISVQLIRTASTDLQVTYDVGYLYRNPWTQLPVPGRLGVIAISGAGPVDLDDILALPAPVPNVPDALAQALAAAADAMQAAQEANAAALMALMGTGTGFDSVQQMVNSTIGYGSNSITHNGETISLTVAVGDRFVVKGVPAPYEVVDAADDDFDLENDAATPLRLKLILEGIHRIYAGAFGLFDSATEDQSLQLNKAVKRCSAARCRLFGNGMEVRVARQSTSDDTYKYVASNRGGTVRRYGVRVPDGGWMVLEDITIGNLEENNNQYIFHSVNAERIEIGDGVTLDGHVTSAAAWGGRLHLMQCQHLHYGNCRLIRGGVDRFGASPEGRSVLSTATTPYFGSDVGSFSFGGKPGGFQFLFWDQPTFENIQGCISFENEDEDGFNDDGAGGELWDTKIVANVNFATVINCTAEGTTHAAFTVQDGRYSTIHFGGVYADGVSGDPGYISSLFKIGGGQENRPASSVVVDSLQLVRVETLCHYDCTEGGGERIVFNNIKGNKISHLLEAATVGGGFSDFPEGAKLIEFNCSDVGDIAGPSAALSAPGVALSTKNSDATYTGNIVQTLRVNGLKAENVYSCIAYLEDVGTVEFNDLDIGDVTAFVSSQPYSNFSFWFAGDTLKVNGLRIGGAHNRVFMLAPKVEAHIRGLDLVDTDASYAAVLDGAGDITFEDGQIRDLAATPSINDLGQVGGGSVSYTGNLRFRNFKAPAISSYLDPVEVVGSDIYKVTQVVAPGEVAAGATFTADVPISGLNNGDRIMAYPATALSGAGNFTWSCHFVSTNTARLYLTNIGATQDPGSRTWTFKAERG